MKLVHMADLHQGFKRYSAQTKTGANQREADVALALTHAITRTIALAPDVVIVAGDVFHQPHPSNPAIVHTFSEFQRLTLALPHCIVVMLAGNHDLSRSTDTVCILRLFARLGIHVVDVTPERLTFPDRDLSILCIPEVQSLAIPIEPDPSCRYNVLAVHGETRGIIKAGHSAALVYEPDALARPEWDYVAFGHFHDFTQIAPRGFYSGAIEYTTSDCWHEAPVKGIIEYDLDAHVHTFHPLPSSRVHIDLPAIEGRGLTPDELNAAILASVESIDGGIAEKVVRLVVRDVEPEAKKQLDAKLLRQCRASAMQFLLDVKTPARDTTVMAGGRSPKLQSLTDLIRDALGARPLPNDINRDELAKLGVQYLDTASEADSPIREAQAA